MKLPRGSLTNELRYESNDSRDIENGSFSLSMLRWLDVVVDEAVRCQKLFFSVGEGYRVLISVTGRYRH